MKIGYIRVSTEEQNHQRQIDSLESVCDKLFTEYASAASKKRPVFDKALKSLKAGDTLVVHDLDRAFRSTVDALNHAERLKARGIEFRILSLHVDTNTPAGQLVYAIMAAFAEYERKCLSQRTKEGMAAAKKRGKHIGRPRKKEAD
jgi:DNA invertase Pin-like site-specific DNA recombinase